jgi:hypothetical protein
MATDSRLRELGLAWEAARKAVDDHFDKIRTHHMSPGEARWTGDQPITAEWIEELGRLEEAQRRAADDLYAHIGSRMEPRSPAL